MKDRRVILTRSKSRDDENDSPTSNRKKTKKNERDDNSDQRESRRNAPSPDIIDGLQHKKLTAEKSSSRDSSTDSSGNETHDGKFAMCLPLIAL